MGLFCAIISDPHQGRDRINLPELAPPLVTPVPMGLTPAGVGSGLLIPSIAKNPSNTFHVSGDLVSLSPPTPPNPQ